MPPDDHEALERLLGALAMPALPVAAILQERLAAVATAKGTTSVWDWISTQAGVQIPDVVRAEMEGALLGWLTFVRVDQPNYNRPASLALALVEALDDNHAFADYLPTLHKLANELQECAQRQAGKVVRDKILIQGLGEIFDRAVGKVTSTKTGPFCRFLDALWEVLPPDRRCARPAFVQYVKTAWDGEESSPLRKRRR